MTGWWARWTAAVAIIVGAAPPAAAESPTVTVGFGDAYRAGAWTAVVVGGTGSGAEGDGGSLHVWAQDPDGQFVRSPAAGVERAGSGWAATARVRFTAPGRGRGFGSWTSISPPRCRPPTARCW